MIDACNLRGEYKESVKVRSNGNWPLENTHMEPTKVDSEPVLSGGDCGTQLVVKQKTFSSHPVKQDTRLLANEKFENQSNTEVSWHHFAGHRQTGKVNYGNSRTKKVYNQQPFRSNNFVRNNRNYELRESNSSSHNKSYYNGRRNSEMKLKVSFASNSCGDDNGNDDDSKNNSVICNGADRGVRVCNAAAEIVDSCEPLNPIDADQNVDATDGDSDASKIDCPVETSTHVDLSMDGSLQLHAPSSVPQHALGCLDINLKCIEETSVLEENRSVDTGVNDEVAGGNVGTPVYVVANDVWSGPVPQANSDVLPSDDASQNVAGVNCIPHLSSDRMELSNGNTVGDSHLNSRYRDEFKQLVRSFLREKENEISEYLLGRFLMEKMHVSPYQQTDLLLDGQGATNLSDTHFVAHNPSVPVSDPKPNCHVDEERQSFSGNVDPGHRGSFENRLVAVNVNENKEYVAQYLKKMLTNEKDVTETIAALNAQGDNNWKYSVQRVEPEVVNMLGTTHASTVPVPFHMTGNVLDHVQARPQLVEDINPARYMVHSVSSTPQQGRIYLQPPQVAQVVSHVPCEPHDVVSSSQPAQHMTHRPIHFVPLHQQIASTNSDGMAVQQFHVNQSYEHPQLLHLSMYNPTRLPSTGSTPNQLFVEGHPWNNGLNGASGTDGRGPVLGQDSQVYDVNAAADVNTASPLSSSSQYFRQVNLERMVSSECDSVHQRLYTTNHNAHNLVLEAAGRNQIPNNVGLVQQENLDGGSGNTVLLNGNNSDGHVSISAQCHVPLPGFNTGTNRREVNQPHPASSILIGNPSCRGRGRLML